MRFIYDLQDLTRMAKCLELRMSLIGFEMNDDEYMSLAAQMLGHEDFDDFKKSLEMPEREDRPFHIQDCFTAEMDPLLYCHTRALEVAGLSIDEAEEFASTLLSDEQWVQALLPHSQVSIVSRED